MVIVDDRLVLVLRQKAEKCREECGFLELAIRVDWIRNILGSDQG